MTPKIRNRLVGSIILVAAAVVIIPSVLDGQKISYKDNFKKVPDRPEFKSVQSSKTFPSKEFDQHLPQTDQTIHDEVALDADPNDGEVRRDNDTAQTTHKVVDNDQLTVATLSKPIDFDQPVVEAQPSRQASSSASTQVKPPAPQSKAEAPAKESPFAAAAWVIQLGAFSHQANAIALEKKLNAAGFVTFNRPITTRTGILTKVYVGPELDKAILDKALSQVNAVANVQGKLVPFTVKR